MRAVLDAWTRLGLDVNAVCRKSGLETAVLENLDARIPLDLGNRTWRVADELWGRPTLGLHTGAAIAFGAYHVLDYLMVTADSVAEGLDAAVRYFRLVTEGATRLERVPVPGADGIGLAFTGPVPLQVRDYALAAIGQRVGHAGGGVTDVQFAGPPLGDVRDYVRVFGAPVRFEQPASLLVVTGTGRRPALAESLPGLRDIVRREADRMARSIDSADGVSDVRAIVSILIPRGRPRLGEVARRLRMAPRTLQRRLAAENLTFTALVDSVRAELAREHLAERSLCIAEIGYLLGFAEPASFTRACARWFGRTPAEIRARGV
jgi:AraC-like DNA-binding protein